MSSQMKQIKAIKEAIKKEDITELRSLAIKHGFINDKLRKKAWPLVLGIKTIQKRNSNNNNINNNSILNKLNNNNNTLKQQDNNTKQGNKLSIPSLTIDTKLPQISEYKTDNNNTDTSIIHAINTTPEYQQIEKDVKRSSLSYYNIQKTSKSKSKSEASLSKILHSLFDDNDDMHYIQGFNDVTSVFYAVCHNEKLAQAITEKVAKTLLSDYVLINNNKNDNTKNNRHRNDLNIQSYRLIFDIIELYDSELNKLFMNSDDSDTNGHDFISISISWLITWFAHHIKDINIISRIYDYCICSNDKFISSYLCAALIIYLKNDLYLAQKHNITLFEYFNDLKWNKLNYNKVIHLSQYLYTKYSNDLNKKFKLQNAMNKSDSNSNSNSDSTDSPPVPITPYTPYTPYTQSQTNTPTKSNNEPHSPFETIEYEKFDKLNNNKKKLKKKIKGFIDDYFGTYNEND